MAISMNLRDLINPQYTAVTGRKSVNPYTAYLTAMGPSVRADALREKETLQGKTQFDASQALERERIDAAKKQAETATILQGATTGLAGVAVANQLGLIGGAAKTAGDAGSLAGVTAESLAGVSPMGLGAAGELGTATALTAVEMAEAGATTAEMSAYGFSLAEIAKAKLAATAPGKALLAAAPYAAPVAAGYVGSQVGHSLADFAGERLKVGGESERGIVGRVAGGTAAGAATGLIGGPLAPITVPVGAAIGAGIGLVDWGFNEGRGFINDSIDAVVPKEVQQVGDTVVEGAKSLWDNSVGKVASGKCIIVTACTSQDSEEVNISREYRDKFLTPEQLRGYYMIAEKAVPWIQHSPLVKRLVKRLLVDHLIAYGRYALDKGPYPGPLAHFVTKQFLRLCGTVGSKRRHFVRCNGETV